MGRRRKVPAATKPSDGAGRRTKLTGEPANASVARGLPEHLEAQRAWLRLSSTEKFQLAREAVQTRAGEWKLGYKDLISVGYGYRTVGAASDNVVQEPCIRFMVARKWRKGCRGPKPAPNQLLPQCVLAYCTLGGKRRLCAIPTDIADGRSYARVRAHANSLVWASTPSVVSIVRGGFCCAVQYRGSGPVYGLGCFHVFGMLGVGGQPPSQVTVKNASNAPIGRLAYYQPISQNQIFDAAVVEITDLAAFQALVKEPRPNALSAVDENGLSKSAYSIHSFQNGPLDATFVGVWPEDSSGKIRYNHYPNLRQKAALVELRILASRVTSGGDSGSPVFNGSGTILQGMHLGGDNRKVFFLPAYELLRASNYLFTSGDGEFTITLP